MRVLFIRSNSVNPDSRVEKEVQTLLEEGYKVDIFCWDREAEYELKKSTKELVNGYSCDVYRIGIKAEYGVGFKKNLIPLLKFQKNIIKFIKKNRCRYTIIHACDFDTAMSAYFCVKKYGLKLIYDIFDYYVDAFHVPKLLKNIIKKIDRHIMEHVDAVIICSEKRIKQIGNIKQEKIVVVHNSPDMTFLNRTDIFQLEKSDSNKTKIAYVGILNDGRMIKELLDFTDKNNEFELHIGGFGKLEKYIKEIATNNTRIHFYGRLEYSKTLELENQCDIMTAIYDPTIKNHIYAAPNKFYEALMLGKPLIMVKNTGFSEIIEKYNIGEAIEYNYESLEEGILKLYMRRNEWMRIRDTERDLYREKYDWRIMKEKLIGLYEDLVC